MTPGGNEDSLTSQVSLRRFLRIWYPWSLLEQCLLIYPVYALMFEDHGLDGLAIASLFMVWSLAAFAAELPAGAAADRWPRHHVLAVGAALRGLGFSCWLIAPGYAGFLIGFLLWGVASALHSGTREALLFDHLAAVKLQDRFQRCWGRTRALHSAGGTLALAAGGLVAVAWPPLPLLLSIALSFASAAVILIGFAAPAAPTSALEASDPPGVATSLRDGLSEVIRHRGLLLAVLAVALAPAAINAYEEFVPLFLREQGVSIAGVGLLFALVYAGFILGAASSEHLDPVPSRHGHAVALGWTGFGAAGLLAAAWLPGFWSVLALGLAFFAWGVFSVGLQSRLQRAIQGRARATITSLAAVGELGAAQIVYIGIGASAVAAGWAGATAWAGSGLALLTLLLFALTRSRTASPHDQP